MRLEIEVVQVDHIGEYRATVVSPGTKFTNLAGWGSTEESALLDLQGALRAHAVLHG